MEFRILGNFEVRGDDGFVIEIGRSRERALLALMLANAGSVLSGDQLIDALWAGVDLPANPGRALQTAIYRLRQAIEQGAGAGEAQRLLTRPPGYVFEAAGAMVDAERFVDLVKEAHVEPTAARTIDLLDEALALWRGAAFQDFAQLGWQAAPAARLEEMRVQAMEDRATALLTLDRHAEVAVETAKLVAEHPHRETLWAQLMTARYRSGDEEEALHTYVRARAALAEIGLEPGRALQELELSILMRQPARDTREIPRAAELSAPLDSFVGRSAEVADVLSRLADSRLVTLTGPGGVGKSRLASEAARRSQADYEDGVVWVSLQGAATAAEVGEVVADVMGLRDVRASAAPESPANSGPLLDFLRPRSMLLIFDECEHVPGEVALLADRLLRNCPRLRILLTSRHRLNVAGEAVYPVPALSTTSGMGPDALSDAARLFADRARAVDPGFKLDNVNAAAVTELVARLDGLPLAIELAAVRVAALTVQEILSRLDDRFSVLSPTGPLDKRRTLDHTMRWSLEMASAEDRDTFACVSVFEGSWTIDMAAAVCARPEPEVLDSIMRLVDQSLVQPRRAPSRVGQAQFGMLRIMQRYGRRFLDESGRYQEVRARHLGFFSRSVAQRLPALEARHQNDAIRWFRAAKADTYRAMDWALEHDPGSALRLAGDLAWFWIRGGLPAEGTGRLRRAIDGHTVSGRDRAHALLLASSLEVMSRPMPFSGVRFRHPLVMPLEMSDGSDESSRAAWNLANEAREEYAAIGDAGGVAASNLALGQAAAVGGDIELGLSHIEEGIEGFDDSTSSWARAVGALLHANVSLALDRHDEAEQDARRAVETFLALEDTFFAIWAMDTLARNALASGDIAGALQHLDAALALDPVLAERPGAILLYTIRGAIAGYTHDWDDVSRQFGQALSLARRLGFRRGVGMVRAFQGLMFVERGMLPLAVGVLEEAWLIFDDVDDRVGAEFAGAVLGLALATSGRTREAEQIVRASLSLVRSAEQGLALAAGYDGLAVLAHQAGRRERAVTLIGLSDGVRSRAVIPRLPHRSRQMAELRHLGEEALGAAARADPHAAGMAMSFEEGIAYALDADSGGSA